MPVYEYRCENGHTFEVMQRMSDDPVATCPECGAPVQRVFHPVAVHFKGSGFYTTDYGKKKTAAAADSGAKKDSEGGGKEPAKSDSKPGSSSSSSGSSSSKSGSGSASSD
ncbi:MAG TPA: FmdB family zinc ribbon protein [Thermoleophilaceae bacterium]|nr:FmdB family zinc ribbon protein [Thermoleophilaceae bacterium]